MLLPLPFNRRESRPGRCCTWPHVFTLHSGCAWIQADLPKARQDRAAQGIAWLHQTGVPTESTPGITQVPAVPGLYWPQQLIFMALELRCPWPAGGLSQNRGLLGPGQGN